MKNPDKRNLAVVIRTFQRGAEWEKPFNQETFDKGVQVPLAAFLTSAPPELKQVVVVSCADPMSPLREEVDAVGMTPSTRAVIAAFPEEIKSGRIKVVTDLNWGQNPGSASALNVGWHLAAAHGANLVLSWNPDFNLSGHVLFAALEHMARHNLELCGFYRKRYWNSLALRQPQNTATIYAVGLLEAHGGFSPRCDGNSGETVVVAGKELPLAGMDDWYFRLTAHKNAGHAIPWGMYGTSSPSDWKVDFPEDDDKQRDFDNKLLRQDAVMSIWAKELFPDVPFNQLMDQVFAALVQA